MFLHVTDNIYDSSEHECEVIQITSSKHKHYFELYEKQTGKTDKGKEFVWYKIKHREYKHNDPKINEPMALWYSTAAGDVESQWIVRKSHMHFTSNQFFNTSK